MSKIILWIFRHLSQIAGAILLAVGVYLFVDIMGWNGRISKMDAWLKENGDADLQKYYAEVTDPAKRKALGMSFLAYEKRYGKGAWVGHFKASNVLGGRITYADLVELAASLSDGDATQRFLDTHASAYDACVLADRVEDAHHYADVLKELQDIGGQAWHVAQKDSFVVCVYEAVRNQPELQSWYFDNYEWCTRFLSSLEPGAGIDLSDAVMTLKRHANVVQAFDKELSLLTDDEVSELADDDVEAKVALYESCLIFVDSYGEMLRPLLDGGAPMLTAMAVVANNCDAFVLNTSEDFRKAGVEMLGLYRDHRILWDLAAEESGVGVIKYYHEVPQWAEQILDMFGEMNVVTFLHKFYNDSEDLLVAASETLYKCQEPGWAVLSKYRENEQFKSLLSNKKIGCRLVPYILKKGEESAFTDLWEDPRWVDEYFDKDGNLKRQDVSWYELSPVGGDLATAVKKWAQGRPVTAGEIGWAAFDVADAAAMAFSLGMSKAATTAAKTGGKLAAKKIARNAEKKLIGTQVRRIEQKMVTRRLVSTGLVNGQRRIGDAALKTAVKKSRKGFSVLRRMTWWINPSSMKSMVKTTKTSLGKAWKTAKNVKPETWKKAYKTSKAIMWLGFAHKVETKGPDFIHNIAEDTGKLAGRLMHAIISGAGDGLKAAVKESLGIESETDSLLKRLIKVSCSLLVFVLAVVLLKNRS